ncbi:unnamed protein product [Lupinus luteus]|uniref:BED-type domain-containing protein n=1 Tax=Lupinus luteus TaxID=3873 RepID=A0AAV1WFU5_LUPLU
MEDVENDIQESQSVELGKSKKWSKSLTSDLCKSFTKMGVGDDRIERAKCNGCKAIYRCGISDDKDYGTTHLRRHRGRCTKIRHDDIGQIVMDKEGKLTPRKIDQMVVRDMLAAAIIEHPFKFVEFKKIRCLINYLSLDFIPVSRNKTKTDLMVIYMIEKVKLIKGMSSIPTRISLTSDL